MNKTEETIPQITAIITTFNRAPFLEKAIGSVLGQTFKDFELLVLDNSSKDNTEEIVKSFNDKKIKYIKHEPISISEARNLGAKKASGEFVAFLDDDDEWLPDKLQDQIDIFKKRQIDTTLVYGGFVWVNENNKIIGRHLPVLRGHILKDLLSQKDYFTGSASNPMIRKSVFKNIGYYNESVLTGEDWEFYLRLAQKYKIDFTNKIVVKISQHSGARLGDSLLEAAKLELLVMKKYSKVFKENPRLRSLYLQKIGGKLCRIGKPKQGRIYLGQAIGACPLSYLVYVQYFLSFFGSSFYRVAHGLYKNNVVNKIVQLVKRAPERILTRFRIIKIYKNFPTYFANRLDRYNKPFLTLVLRSGTRYRIRSRKITQTDYYVINETHVHGIHNGTKKYLKNNSLVFDIGAHIGAFSIFAAKQAKNIQVYGFEPVEENIKLFRENIKLNHFEKNVKAVQLGIAGQKGERKLFLSQHDTGMHSLFPDHLERVGEKNIQRKYCKIKCITLKDVFEKYQVGICDVLKMDCEGAEYEILYSTPKDYLRRIRFLSIEYHKNGKETMQKLKEFLEKNSFKVVEPYPNFGVIWAENLTII